MRDHFAVIHFVITVVYRFAFSCQRRHAEYPLQSWLYALLLLTLSDHDICRTLVYYVSRFRQYYFVYDDTWYALMILCNLRDPRRGDDNRTS
jgi:hypothetical protein